MPLEIYHFSGSAPSRSVLMLIKGLNLKHTIKITNIMEGEQFKPEFLKMNPLHTVPVISDNGWKLYDSHVIMKYLIDQYAEDDKLCPKEPKKGAIVNLRCYFNACYLFPKFLDYFAKTIIKGTPGTEEMKKSLQEVLEILDGYLSSSTFVAGNNLTIADLSIIATISTIDACGFDLTEYANLRKWYLRTQDALADFAYEEVCLKGANLVGELYKKAIMNSAQ